MERLRLIHVITKLELGGAQQNTLYCVRHHDRERFDVSLLAGAGGLLDDEARAIPDAAIRLVPWLRHPISPFHDVVALVRMTAAFRAGAYDVVHTHSSKAGILGRAAARACGRRPVVVHTVHGWSFNPTQSRLERRVFAGLERRAARVTDRLIVVADGDRARGLRERIGSPERYRLVRSGIDPEPFRTAAAEGRSRVRAELGVAPGDHVVGTLACLKPQKAPLDFVRAASSVVRARAGVTFVIAGDGPLRGEAERAAREAGLGRRLRFLGWRRDVPDVLAALDTFVLTSRFEGLPRAVLQAMAASRPVVATAVDGTPEVVEDGVTGLLAPPGDTARLADAIVRLVDTPQLGEALAERASARLDASFDIRRMVPDLEAIYLDAIESRRTVRGAAPARG